MPPRRLYEPSPAIPPGLDRADWLAMLDALGREVARIATMGADPQARFPGVGRTSRLAHAAAGLDALWGIDDATAAAVDLAGQRIVDALGAAGEKVLAAQDEHAALSVHDLADFMRGAGMPIVADPGVAAAAAARTKTAMLHDWEALEERTRAAVRDGVRGAALSGGGVASVVAAITEAGAMSWARAVLIARTEMADLYDSARFATMRAPENAATFSGGWWWRARPDACAICQALHGEVFDVGTDPQRHHQCRCIVVPYTAAAPPPPHRSADDIAAQLPASWPRLDTRDDYRRLVGLRENRRWRPSHTMRHPDRVAGHPTWGAGPKPGAPLRSGIAPTPPPPAPVWPPARPTPGPPATRHRIELEPPEDWRETAGRLFGAPNFDSWEEHGYSALDIAAAQRAARDIRWANDGHGFRVLLDVGANNWHGLSDAVLTRRAEFAYRQAMNAYDLLPENLQRRLNFSDARMEVYRENSATAAWAFPGTREAPRFGINYGNINQATERRMPNAHGWHTRGETALNATQNVTYLLHEYGHLLDPLTDAEAEALFEEMVGADALTADSVSEYGMTDGREMVAEMFVDYLGGTLDATRPELRRVIDVMGWEE